MTPQFPLACGDRTQKERRSVAVEIEIYESAIRFDILVSHIFQERAFAGSRLADHGDMHRPLRGAQKNVTARRLAVDRAHAEFEATEPCLVPSPTGKTLDKLFEKVSHVGSKNVEIWGGTR